MRRLRSLASRAADFFGLGTTRALAVAGLAWQPAGCWRACGDVALASCEASAFVRSFWSHSHCARRRFPPVSSSSSTTSLLADHSAEPRSGGDDIVIDGCRGISFAKVLSSLLRKHKPTAPWPTDYRLWYTPPAAVKKTDRGKLSEIVMSKQVVLRQRPSHPARERHNRRRNVSRLTPSKN